MSWRRIQRARYHVGIALFNVLLRHSFEGPLRRRTKAPKNGKSLVRPQTPQSEVPQGIEKHYHNGDRKKHKGDDSNNNPWDRR